MKKAAQIIFVLSFMFNSNHSFSQSVDKVDAFGITVSDLDRAVEFYTQVLKFQKISEIEVAGSDYEKLKGIFGVRYRKARLRLGDEEIELTDYLTAGGRPIPVDFRSNDLAFQHIAIVVADMDSAYRMVRKHGITHVSSEPQTLPKSIPAAEGIKAFYFRDPDGHNLELIWYPPGKGDVKWQTKRSKLFLGIDHSAIGISNTSVSKKFYNELLGVTYQGESLNAGVEQEHLNNVFGAHIHISGNRARQGMGVEFLEYITPRNGRPYPADERADDLIHWEILLTTTDLLRMYKKLKSSGVQFVSSDIVKIPDQHYLYRQGFYVRDPDGHVVGIFEN
jgi:catechol 2,3-dioxygenase-like lactoylglutathione lyase family enzyme